MSVPHESLERSACISAECCHIRTDSSRNLDGLLYYGTTLIVELLHHSDIRSLAAAWELVNHDDGEC